MKELFREKSAMRLRELRAGKKYTIEEVAEKTGVSKDTIARYENNLVSMKIDFLAQILTAYDTNLAIFFEEIIAKTQKENEVK